MSGEEKAAEAVHWDVEDGKVGVVLELRVGEVLEGWVWSWKGGCGPGRVGVVLEGWVWSWKGPERVGVVLEGEFEKLPVGWGLKEEWF